MKETAPMKVRIYRKRKYSDDTHSLRAGNKISNESTPNREISNHENDGVEVKTNSIKPKKHLDDIFKKTKTTPCLYWRPSQ